MMLRAICTIALAGGMAAASAQISPPPASGAASKSPVEIGYYIAAGRPVDAFRPSDPELARWALEAWQRTIGSGIRFVSAPEDEALVRIYWASAFGGQYGEMRPLTVGSRSGAAVYIRPDISGLGEDVAERASRDPLLRETIVYLTCVHELGHALGLPHTNDYRDIMYSFGYGGDIVEYFGRYRRLLTARDDIARVAGVSEADAARIRGRFR